MSSETQKLTLLCADSVTFSRLFAMSFLNGLKQNLHMLTQQAMNSNRADLPAHVLKSKLSTMHRSSMAECSDNLTTTMMPKTLLITARRLFLFCTCPRSQRNFQLLCIMESKTRLPIPLTSRGWKSNLAKEWFTPRNSTTSTTSASKSEKIWVTHMM